MAKLQTRHETTITSLKGQLNSMGNLAHQRDVLKVSMRVTVSPHGRGAGLTYPVVSRPRRAATQAQVATLQRKVADYKRNTRVVSLESAQAAAAKATANAAKFEKEAKKNEQLLRRARVRGHARVRAAAAREQAREGAQPAGVAWWSQELPGAVPLALQLACAGGGVRAAEEDEGDARRVQ